MYIDTHCHLVDEKFTDLTQTVKEYTEEKVSVAINMGCCLSSSESGRKLAEAFESIYFAVGFHPSDISLFTQNDLQPLSAYCAHKKCLAIGEIGLDFYWPGYDKAQQIEGFISQIELANQQNLPICVHMRDATQDTLQVLKNHKANKQGVIHCYAGSVETAKILLDLGYYISFGGTLTFKNANKLLDVAKYVPIDRVLTETDSPYLAPHPYRGSLNTPKNIPLVVQKLAELKGVEHIELAKIVMQNAKSLFYKLP